MKAILAIIVLAIFTASTADASQRATAPSKEVLLVQSGFKLVTVTTPQQKEAVSGLAQGRCSAVTYNRKLFYVFPTATKDKFYVGKQAQFNAYTKALQAQGSRRIVTVEQPPRTKPVQPVEPQKNDNDQRTVEVPPPPPPKQHEDKKPDCTVTATEYFHRLAPNSAWANILPFGIIEDGHQLQPGHSMAVWKITDDGNVLAIDDNGTITLHTTSTDANVIAEELGKYFSVMSGKSVRLVRSYFEVTKHY